MSTPTTARTYSERASHWYYPNGLPCYELPKAKGKGTRAPTLADAREMGLLFSVSRVIDQLAKPALQSWLIEQAVLACLTSPRLSGEDDDAFVKRVLQKERQQDAEARAARNRGTEIHEALESLFNGLPVQDEIAPWVMPAFDALQKKYGNVHATEAVLVGQGYAGKADLITEADECFWIWDFKSTKRLPEKEPWKEHKLQLSAYANAFDRKKHGKYVRPGNCYISTVDEGKYALFEHQESWIGTFERGFAPLLAYLCWETDYTPPGFPAITAHQNVVEESVPQAAPPPLTGPEAKPWVPDPAKRYVRTKAVRAQGGPVQ